MAVTRSEEIREGIKQAAREITDPPLSSMFGAKVALTEMDNEELDTKEASSTAGTTEASIFRTAWNNEREAAAGSIDGVYTRTWDAHNKKLREAEQQKKRDDVTDLLALLGDMEEMLADKYGENFAEDLFSDLHEKGLIDDDEYDRIMAIEDPEERRQAIAAAIQKGLDDGTITMDDLKDHPRAEQWLSMHKDAVEKRNLEAGQGLSGEKSFSELSVDGTDQAGSMIEDK